MAEKIGRPTKMTELTLKKLEEAFALGCSDTEACLYADISHQTLYTYQGDNPEFLERKNKLKETPVLLARKSVIKGMQDDSKLAFDYLKNKKSDEFKTKETKEVTGEDGKPIDIRTISSTSEWISGLLGAGKKDTSKTSS